MNRSIRTIRSSLLLTCIAVWAGCGDDGAAGEHDARPRLDAAEVVDAPSTVDGGAIDARAPDAGSACGTCPGTSVCGTANGMPVCRAPSGIPRFDRVFVVVMENVSLATLQGSTTPYLHMLMSTTAQSTNYHGVDHPSLPNYLALVSGGTGSVGCDCDPTGSACNALTCNPLIHTCGCPVGAQHLGDQLETAGITWRAYAESMGAACNFTNAGTFATRHVPFAYFNDMQSNPARCAAHVIDYSMLDTSATAPRFAFIAPNLVNDMHDPIIAGAQNYTNGDTWLAAQIPRILASPAFTAHSLMVIVWDEDDLSGVLAPDDPVPMFVLSPLAKHAGFTSTGRADHYRLLATIEDGLGLPRLGAAGPALPLTDFFPAQ